MPEHVALSLMTTAVWALRALAASAGAFVVIDWAFRSRQTYEMPPHNRRVNSAAWAGVGAGSLLAWLSYINLDLYVISPRDGILANAMLALTWALIGGALVMRAAARAEQPKLIWISAALIAVGSFVVLAMGGRPGI